MDREPQQPVRRDANDHPYQRVHRLSDGDTSILSVRDGDSLSYHYDDCDNRHPDYGFTGRYQLTDADGNTCSVGYFVIDRSSGRYRHYHVGHDPNAVGGPDAPASQRPRSIGDLGVPVPARGSSGLPDQARRDGPVSGPMGQLRRAGLHIRGGLHPYADGGTTHGHHTGHFHPYNNPDDPTCTTYLHDNNDAQRPHDDGDADGHEHTHCGPAFRDPDGLFIAKPSVNP